MALKTTIFDPAEYLETEDDIIAYLDASMEGGDPKHIARAIGDVARSKGMTELARKTGVGGRRCMQHFPITAIQRLRH